LLYYAELLCISPEKKMHQKLIMELENFNYPLDDLLCLVCKYNRVEVLVFLLEKIGSIDSAIDVVVIGVLQLLDTKSRERMKKSLEKRVM
jgi:hypothetical protein